MDAISDAGARAPNARSEIVTLSIEELEALARAELEEGLRALTERLPQLRLAGEPPLLRGHSGIRRIGDMRVTWRS